MGGDDFPDYQVYRQRSEFQGSDVFELFAGDFADGVTWWNPGSIYIREESFEPFNTLVLGAAPNFDWYGETRLACLQIERLLTDLGTLRDKIGRAGSTDELRVAFGGDFRWYSADIPFRLETRRTQLLAIADAIAGIGRNALSHRTSLWLLGL